MSTILQQELILKHHFFVLSAVAALVVGSAQAGDCSKLSNEAFAAEVKRLVVELKRDPKAQEQAVEFCRALSKSRAEDEPKCTAAHEVAWAATMKPNPVRLK